MAGNIDSDRSLSSARIIRSTNSKAVVSKASLMSEVTSKAVVSKAVVSKAEIPVSPKRKVLLPLCSRRLYRYRSGSAKLRSRWLVDDSVGMNRV